MKKTTFSKIAKTSLLSVLVISGISWDKNPEIKATNNTPTITIDGLVLSALNQNGK